MSFKDKNTDLNHTLSCHNCGATLQYEPGTFQLKCSYCGTINEIEQTNPDDIQALDYEAFIAGNSLQPENKIEIRVVQCRQCGAQTSLPDGITSELCAFCNSPLVVSTAKNEQLLRPHYILPFLLKAKEAEERLSNWMSALWFAPSTLIKNVKQIQRDHFVGMYLPHWAYDTETETSYDGQQGIHYWGTESYTTEENGKTVTRTRQVQRTRWYPVSGRVSCSFKDVLVLASNSLSRNVADKLEPWQLDKLQVFDERYISGFRSETYRIDAVAGLNIAKRKMEDTIISAIYNDIGGDEQQISDHESTYNHIKLKYNLLPIWISAYQFKNKVYQIAINATTGEVIGERPYSALKIIFAVLVVILIVLIIYLVAGG
ncbi:zinc finger domain-containing protein, LSD1 subclass [bacterium A37T11]|nr:zinc finger domain-containing protein, LSD1 subclass [bacterium A37T11]